jgi:ribosomal protein L40E
VRHTPPRQNFPVPAPEGEQTLSPDKCSICGAVPPGGAAFCHVCGNKIENLRRGESKLAAPSPTAAPIRKLAPAFRGGGGVEIVFGPEDPLPDEPEEEKTPDIPWADEEPDTAPAAPSPAPVAAYEPASARQQPSVDPQMKTREFAPPAGIGTCPKCNIVLPPGRRFCPKCKGPAKFTPAPEPHAATPEFPAVPPPLPVHRPGSKCPKCGTEPGPEAAFCRVCGTRIEAVPPPDPPAPKPPACRKCGTTLSPGARFCRSCGTQA